MVKPILLIAGAIPVILAILIVIPMITKPDIPFSATVPTDTIELEYTKYHLKKISFGVTDEIQSLKTEILVIKDDGSVRYSLVEDGVPQPEKKITIDETTVNKLTAMIKETGFMSIPEEPFSVKKDIDEYDKLALKVTLNGNTKQVQWPEQNATDQFIPPIMSQIELELDNIIDDANS